MIWLTLLLILGIAQDSLPEFVLSWNKDKGEVVRIGDKLGFSVEGLCPEGDCSKFTLAPANEKTTFMKSGWHLLAQEWVSPQNLKIFLVPLRSGSEPTPEIVLKNAEGKPVAKISSLIIKVEANSEGDPDALMPPRSLEFPWIATSIIGFLIMLVAVLLVFGIIKWLSKRRKPVAVVQAAPVPVLSPHQIALKKLAELNSQQYWQKGMFKQHSFGISEILKEYLGGIYGFDAQESTTTELFHRLEKAEPDRAIRETLAELFESLDRIKFTDYQSDVAEAKKQIERAKNFVIERSGKREPTSTMGVSRAI